MRSGEYKRTAGILRRGGTGVLATDTIYGLVACALRRRAVERVYRLRKRDPRKPCIILIASRADLKKFGIELSGKAQSFLKAVWPGRVSVIVPCASRKFSYLHRGTKSLAFRLPNNAMLRRFLRYTGPLIAPSANPEGKDPATTIKEARQYFGNRADFYCDSGKRVSKPSTIISLTGKIPEYIRKGAQRIPASALKDFQN